MKNKALTLIAILTDFLVGEVMGSMEILSLIHEDLIFPNLDVADKNDLFTVLSEHLKKQGYVKASFLNGVADREKQYPTGLQLKAFGCALPHTDLKHVIKPAITVATLKHPVVFKSMENARNEVSVNLVFMLALNKSEYQIQSLKQLAMLLQNDTFVESLVHATDALEIYGYLLEVNTHPEQLT